MINSMMMRPLVALLLLLTLSLVSGSRVLVDHDETRYQQQGRAVLIHRALFILDLMTKQSFKAVIPFRVSTMIHSFWDFQTMEILRYGTMIEFCGKATPGWAAGTTGQN